MSDINKAAISINGGVAVLAEAALARQPGHPLASGARLMQ